MADINKKKEKLRKLATSAIFRRMSFTADDGSKYEIVQPSIKRRNDIREACFKGNTDFDSVKFQILMVIECTVVPKTDDKVFEVADYDTLANQPSGSIVDSIWAVMLSDQRSAELELAKKLYPNLENSSS